MTAPDSRDSVERVVAEMRDAAGATSDHYEAQSLRKFARRLQALARGPQQAGGEDAKDAARYRWLRRNANEVTFYGEGTALLWFSPLDDDQDMAGLDAAIDAALNGGQDDA